MSSSSSLLSSAAVIMSNWQLQRMVMLCWLLSLPDLVNPSALPLCNTARQTITSPRVHFGIDTQFVMDPCCCQLTLEPVDPQVAMPTHIRFNMEDLRCHLGSCGWELLVYVNQCYQRSVCCTDTWEQYKSREKFTISSNNIEPGTTISFHYIHNNQASSASNFNTSIEFLNANNQPDKNVRTIVHCGQNDSVPSTATCTTTFPPLRTTSFPMRVTTTFPSRITTTFPALRSTPPVSASSPHPKTTTTTTTQPTTTTSTTTATTSTTTSTTTTTTTPPSLPSDNDTISTSLLPSTSETTSISEDITSGTTSSTTLLTTSLTSLETTNAVQSSSEDTTLLTSLSGRDVGDDSTTGTDIPNLTSTEQSWTDSTTVSSENFTTSTINFELSTTITLPAALAPTTVKAESLPSTSTSTSQETSPTTTTATIISTTTITTTSTSSTPTTSSPTTTTLDNIVPIFSEFESTDSTSPLPISPAPPTTSLRPSTSPSEPSTPTSPFTPSTLTISIPSSPPTPTRTVATTPSVLTTIPSSPIPSSTIADTPAPSTVIHPTRHTSYSTPTTYTHISSTFPTTRSTTPRSYPTYRISNTTTVRSDSIPYTTSEEPSKNATGNTTTGGSSPSSIGLIVGIIVAYVLLIIVVVGVVVFITLKKRKKRRQRKRGRHSKDDDNSLVYQDINELTRGYHMHNNFGSSLGRASAIKASNNYNTLPPVHSGMGSILSTGSDPTREYTATLIDVTAESELSIHTDIPPAPLPLPRYNPIDLLCGIVEAQPTNIQQDTSLSIVTPTAHGDVTVNGDVIPHPSTQMAAYSRHPILVTHNSLSPQSSIEPAYPSQRNNIEPAYPSQQNSIEPTYPNQRNSIRASETGSLLGVHRPMILGPRYSITGRQMYTLPPSVRTVTTAPPESSTLRLSKSLHNIQESSDYEPIMPFYTTREEGYTRLHFHAGFTEAGRYPPPQLSEEIRRRLDAIGGYSGASADSDEEEEEEESPFGDYVFVLGDPETEANEASVVQVGGAAKGRKRANTL